MWIFVCSSGAKKKNNLLFFCFDEANEYAIVCFTLAFYGLSLSVKMFSTSFLDYAGERGKGAEACLE